MNLYTVTGNGPMTVRYITRNIFNALKIVWGFVFKAVTTDASLCRELFFDKTLSDEMLAR